VGGIIVGFIVAVMVWPGEREPEYQGKKLGEWIGTMKPVSIVPIVHGLPIRVDNVMVRERGGHSEQEVRDAVSHMGTNGLRFLVRWVGYEPPKWRSEIRNYCWKLQMKLNRARPYEWLTPKQEYRAMAAGATLRSLGREVMPVMSDLQRIAANTNTPAAAACVRIFIDDIYWQENRVLAPASSISTNQPKGTHYVLKSDLLLESSPRFEPLPR
jgi:hypothetical protein